MIWQNFLENLISWFLSRGLKIVAILIATPFVIRFIGIFIRRLIKPFAGGSPKLKGVVDGKILKQREKTLEGVFISVLSITVWLIAILTILPEFGINIGPLLGGAGIVGLAIGMGSRSLIQDYLSGLFILFEDQYRVGEEIEIAGIKGRVKNLNLRRTVLENPKGTIFYIPNGQIRKVSNFSRSINKLKK